MKPCFYSFTRKKLEEYFLSSGETASKAALTFRWIYRGEKPAFRQALAEKLLDTLSFELPREAAHVFNEDTHKFLFELSDGSFVEAVLMHHSYGYGICISTQIGCRMGCVFCESGRLKRRRNLEPGEMVGQILAATKSSGITPSHIVLMGIGEPFDNYDNVMDFIDIVTDAFGLGFGARHITVSTGGIVPLIRKYALREVPNSLAISLHAPNDSLRSRLMPVNRVYPLSELMESLRFYSQTAHRRVTVEYIMLRGINDTPECAAELVPLLSGLDCYVNLIPYNATENDGFEASDSQSIARFFDYLKSAGVMVTVRREFGAGLNAACGQLSSEYSRDE